MFSNEFPDSIIKVNNERILSSLNLIESQKKESMTNNVDEIDNCDKNDYSDNEKVFLWDVYNRPYVSITERYKTITIEKKLLSAGKGTRLVNSLVQKNLLKVHEINLGGRGGGAKFLELTEKGYDAISMKPKPGIGKGAGYEHGFWQQHIAERLKSFSGINNIKIEGLIMDKSVDILIETEQGKFAIEIAMSSEHEKINVEKDMAAGCSRIFIGCKDKSTLETVSKMTMALSDDIRDKIVTCLVQKVIEEIRKCLQNTGENHE